MNKREQLKQALAELSGTINTNPENGRRSAFAETIVQMAEPNRLTFEVFNTFMNVATLKTGDNIMKKVRKGRYPVR